MSSSVELKNKLIDMEEIILKELIKNRSLDTCNDFVIWADKSDLEPLAKKIAEAITVTHCCKSDSEQLCDKLSHNADTIMSGKCSNCDSEKELY